MERKSGEEGSRVGGVGEVLVGVGGERRGGREAVVAGKRARGGFEGGFSGSVERVGGRLVVGEVVARVESSKVMFWEGRSDGDVISSGLRGFFETISSLKVTFLEDGFGGDGGLRDLFRGISSSSMFAFFRSFSMSEGLRPDISSCLAASISSFDI